MSTPSRNQRLGYRIKELCQASGLGRTTIYKLIRSGRLKVVRIGGCTIVTASSAETLLGGQEGGAE
ncbi:helix-turn-helix domain-containing protein [Roseobacter sp. AzwK-3b]|uniref:helix-turn-helix transcriptional regulator n=1 Tax=Roseobacter sp. AzwK-3b TaxID=351016 RepID=UPI0012F49475